MLEMRAAVLTASAVWPCRRVTSAARLQPRVRRLAMGRLLIVDHHRREALDLQQRVTHLGHTVLAIAASGQEALALAAALQPDLVLMEVRLPGPVDGLQAGTQIWVRFEIPVIYVSEHLTAHTVQRLWPTCQAGLLGKHIGVRDLRKALEEVLACRGPIPVEEAGRRR
jgi:DNA-binding NarL/FixJ family response regulator